MTDLRQQIRDINERAISLNRIQAIQSYPRSNGDEHIFSDRPEGVKLNDPRQPGWRSRFSALDVGDYFYTTSHRAYKLVSEWGKKLNCRFTCSKDAERFIIQRIE